MPAPKKDAAKAPANPTPAPAETPGAPAPAQPVDTSSSPADTVVAPPPAVVEPEEHEDALAKLANEADDDAPETPAPASVPAPKASEAPAGPPDAPALASSPGPTNPVMSEADILREQIDRMRRQYEADMREASDRIAALSHKPPPAPVPTRDPLREAKLFGVLATWKGPGTYGGPYYTLSGVRMPTATGITTGYFPAADIERHADLFTRVK